MYGICLIFMIWIFGNEVDAIFISEIDSFWHFLVSGFHSKLIKLFGLIRNYSDNTKSLDFDMNS